MLQASRLEDLRLKLETDGLVNISYLVVNHQGRQSQLKHHLLKEKVSEHIHVFQQDENKPDVWSLLNGKKDDFLIYDRCGHLVSHLGLPYTFLSFPYVEEAIRNVYCENKCGSCNYMTSAVDDVCNTTLMSPAGDAVEEQPPAKTPKEERGHGHRRHHHHHHNHEGDHLAEDNNRQASAGDLKPHSQNPNRVRDQNRHGQQRGQQVVEIYPQKDVVEFAPHLAGAAGGRTGPETMDEWHRASVLATSCLSTPVNPQTRAPVTLYERQQEAQRRQQRARRAGGTAQEEGGSSSREALDTKDDFDSESDTESDHNFGQRMNQDFEGQMHLAKMSHSNKEYYTQLEQLKNAHLETMAQLESMYQRKLHFKGVMPHCKQDICAVGGYRSEWEQSSFQKANFQQSFAELDLNSMSSSNSWEESDDELTDNHIVSESRVLTPAEKQILEMWSGFSVEDYVQSKPRSPRLKRDKRAKEWSPKITIPEPFQMTMREATKEKHCIKTKSEIEMENNLLKKQLEEEAECQKKFKANPVPASVFLPLYREIMERNEERRNFVKEQRRELLLASQQPFQFIEREERKKEMVKHQLADLSAPKKKAHPFKAKPVPKSIYSMTNNDRLQEEELYRGIKIQMRAQELLQSSAVPSSLLASRSKQAKHKHRCFQEEELHCRPKINPHVPDFEVLHRRFQKQLLKRKAAKPVTVCEPFYLHTLQIPSNKGKILKDIQADEEELKETRWPYQTPRCKPNIRCSSANSSLRRALESEPPRTTESTKRRQQAIRNHEKQRMKDYFQELGQMEARIDKRPLLLERVTQSNARMSAERHFSNVLKEVGLKEDFVSKKGRNAKWQDHLSDEESENSDQDIKNSYVMVPENSRTSPQMMYGQNGLQAETAQVGEFLEEDNFQDNCERNDFEYEDDEYTSGDTCSDVEAD